MTLVDWLLYNRTITFKHLIKEIRLTASEHLGIVWTDRACEDF